MALILAAAFSNAFAAVEVILVASNEEKLDPIITGASTSKQDIEDWKAARDRFEECGLCGEMQEFPEELPE